MFGKGELGEREVKAREIEEKWCISLVWKSEEMHGTHAFSESPHLCEEIAESVIKISISNFVLGANK